MIPTMNPKETWKKIWPVLYKKYRRDKTWLDFKTPWQLLVAVVLSAQLTYAF
jgi:endonuclease III